jgi:ribosome-binding factor A
MRWRKRPGHQRLKYFEALNKTHTTKELTSQMAVSHELIAQLAFSEMVLRQLPEFVFDPPNPMRQCIAPRAN